MISPVITKGPSKSTHKIFLIRYSTDTLECICGWVGKARDQDPYGENFNPDIDWPTHKKKAPPVGIEILDQYKKVGIYNRTAGRAVLKPSKEKVLV